MGSPISSTVAEIFLQHLEDTHKTFARHEIHNLLHKIRRRYPNNIRHQTHKI